MEFLHEESSKAKYFSLFHDKLGLTFTPDTEIFVMTKEDLSVRNRPVLLINKQTLFYFPNISSLPKKYNLLQIEDVQVYEKEERVFMKITVDSLFYILIFLNRNKAKEIFKFLKINENKKEENKVAVLVKFGGLRFIINVPESFNLDSFKKRCIFRIGKYFCPDKIFSETMIDLEEYKEYRFTVWVEGIEVLLENDSDFKAAKTYCDNKINVSVTLDERKQYKECWKEKEQQ